MTSRKNTSQGFGFTPIKFVNLKQEVVVNRGRVRHYQSQAKCNILGLSIEQQKIFRGFQKKLGQSEKIVLENDQTRQKIENKHKSLIEMRKQNTDEIHNLRMKKIGDERARPRPPPWIQNPRAKTVDAVETRNNRIKLDTQTLQIRSKSRESIRTARHKFEDSARVISASFPRIKEAWVQNVETVTARDYLKTFESNLTEEKYVRQNMQLYSITL